MPCVPFLLYLAGGWTFALLVGRLLGVDTGRNKDLEANKRYQRFRLGLHCT